MNALFSHNKDFYPTPPELAKKMCSKISLKDVYHPTVLEPSAGKGDLVQALAEWAKEYSYKSYWDPTVEVDVIEIDPALQNTLRGMAENFIREHRNVKSVCLVYDDFLKYNTEKHYDVILANFPFSEGEKHLAKAITMQKRNGGQLICLVNAETIRNPYTRLRQMIVETLAEEEVEYEYIEGAFADAERPTGVEVCLVSVNFPKPKETSKFWEGCKEAEHIVDEAEEDDEPKALTFYGFIDALVAQFDLEIKAGIKLIREVRALQPYILDKAGNDPEKTKYAKPMLELNVKDTNEYVVNVREKYWDYLFSSDQFRNALTSDMSSTLHDQLREMRNYDFNRFNIEQVLKNVMKEMVQGVEDAIIKVFDKLTSHSLGNEKNIHYFTGWKTNSGYKVGPKAIIPGYGCVSDYSWETLSTYRCYEVLSDLEKALNYLDQGKTWDLSLSSVIDCANRNGRTNMMSKYFEIKFYKKGTCHLKFLDEELLEKLNIYGSRKKGWLPPSYGKKRYQDMDPEERAVIDEFQGEEAYEKVLSNAGYFLADPAQEALQALPAASEVV